MTERKLLVSARAKLVVEVRGLGPWSDNVQADQVMRQAKEEALGALMRIFTKVNGQPVTGASRISVVGEPVVTMVLVEELEV